MQKKKHKCLIQVWQEVFSYQCNHRGFVCINAFNSVAYFTETFKLPWPF